MITSIEIQGAKWSETGSLNLPSLGKVTALVGPNSSGKTTTLETVVLLLKFLEKELPYGGNINQEEWGSFRFADIVLTTHESPSVFNPLTAENELCDSIRLKISVTDEGPLALTEFEFNGHCWTAAASDFVSRAKEIDNSAKEAAGKWNSIVELEKTLERKRNNDAAAKTLRKRISDGKKSQKKSQVAANKAKKKSIEYVNGGTSKHVSIQDLSRFLKSVQPTKNQICSVQRIRD